ncbi:hypothetical protein CesoFtcFv8_025433 [Champsocephalus esox]|uniref:Uncharacterized protein n=1 Tax=Champsocephalus esox TaxID=159716 RepID=A0AAN8B3T4_9TELE|nr:hypothetical protein CesoFtcFv8_025433 [Champsocephalus esox]
MNGPTSHLPRIDPHPTKCMDGDEEVLNISVYTCFSAFCKKQTCHPSHAESEDVCERQALHAEYMKREVYLGSEEGEGAPLDARCFNIPSAPPPSPPSQRCAQLCLAGTGMGSALLLPLRSTAVSKEMIHG